MQKQFSVFIASVSICSACALLPDKDKTPQAAEKVGEPQARPQASIEAKQLAAEQEARATTEIKFKLGSDALEPGEQSRLIRLSRELVGDTKVNTILIAAWADESLPGANADDLSREARELAKSRGETVRKFLNQRGQDDIEVEFHNMAEKPRLFDKFVGSADARVKKSLEGAKPSRAIVLLIEKD